MASKTYIVMKDGEETGKLKTLTAAKKQADEEGAEVFCGGKCVYQGKIPEPEQGGEASNGALTSAGVSVSEAPKGAAKDEGVKDEALEGAAEEDSKPEPVKDEPEQAIIKAEPVVAKKPAQPETEPVETVRYRLTMLMNIRSKPSLNAHIVSVKPAGTVVRAVGIEGDWLHLSDGNYVLYKDGKYAKKMEE